MKRIAIAFASLATLAFASHSFAQVGDVPNLSGSWTCEGMCQFTGATARIVQSGTNLECWNEANQLSRGSFTSTTTITCWGGGTISADRRVIRWSDGNRWTR